MVVVKVVIVVRMVSFTNERLQRRSSVRVKARSTEVSERSADPSTSTHQTPTHTSSMSRCKSQPSPISPALQRASSALRLCLAGTSVALKDPSCPQRRQDACCRSLCSSEEQGRKNEVGGRASLSDAARQATSTTTGRVLLRE